MTETETQSPFDALMTLPVDQALEELRGIEARGYAKTEHERFIAELLTRAANGGKPLPPPPEKAPMQLPDGAPPDFAPCAMLRPGQCDDRLLTLYRRRQALFDEVRDLDEREKAAHNHAARLSAWLETAQTFTTERAA